MRLTENEAELLKNVTVRVNEINDLLGELRPAGMEKRLVLVLRDEARRVAGAAGVMNKKGPMKIGRGRNRGIFLSRMTMPCSDISPF